VRYYELTISDPQTGEIWQPSSTTDTFIKGTSGPSFSSLVTVGGQKQTNPGALNIEIDVPAIPFNQPQGAALIRVWGIGLGMIGQAANFNPDPYTGRLGANILLKAGMSKGLPLANPAQAGTILQGTVFQSFGNWQGTNMTLDLICYPPAAQDEQDISWSWPAGTTLTSALLNTFRQAFAQYTDMVIDAKNITVADLTLPYDEGGCYFNLQQFAGFMQKHTQAIGAKTYGPQYSGVLITITGNAIYAWDSVSPRAATQLVFTDLIGQPTWIEPAKISFKTVMRSDLAITDQIKFPTTGLGSPYVLTTQNASFPNAPSRDKTIFQGAFTVTEAHHFGNFRQPDADSWVTAYTAVPTPPKSVVSPLAIPGP
jgi:hypothetical protein